MMPALPAVAAAMKKRQDSFVKSNLPTFSIIQELKIEDCIINLEDKLCSPEAKTLDIETKIFKKKNLHIQYYFYYTNKPIMTLEYVTQVVRF